jgi:hypothetical protein
MAIHVQNDFHGANACAIEPLVRGDTDVVRFAAAPHGGTEALWFHLRLVECSSRPLELVLTNVDTLLGNQLEWANVRPVIRHANGAWERAAAPLVRELADGRHHAVWRLRPLYDSLEFAFCYPYSLGEMEVTRAAGNGYWSLDEIGVTAAGRRLPRLTNGYGRPGDRTPGVYLLARQHAGETPGSWVLDGLLRSAVDTVDPDSLRLWIVPLANLDGVLDGDYGKDPFPHDLNRAWTTPPMRHEVLVMGGDMQRWSARCRPSLAVDLHAPGATEADGAYFFLPRAEAPEDQLAACRRATDAVIAALPPELVHQEPVRQPGYPSRWDANGTVGNYVWERLGVPALSMETPYASSRGHLLTRSEYRRLGAALLQGICALIGKGQAP